jgi:hypothetical protein
MDLVQNVNLDFGIVVVVASLPGITDKGAAV